MHKKPEKSAKQSKKPAQVSDLPVKSFGSDKAASVKGGAGLTYGREKLKADSKTMGDFNLTNRDDMGAPVFPKIP